jgi:tetratricopeptide (TPR) repeat protein
LGGDNDYWRSERGELHLLLGNHAEARDDFAQVVDEGVMFVDALVGLAVAHWCLGDADKARDIWQRLISDDEAYNDTAYLQEQLDWNDTLLALVQQMVEAL